MEEKNFLKDKNSKIPIKNYVGYVRFFVSRDNAVEVKIFYLFSK